MYSVSDVIEMGEARELVLSGKKEEPVLDDSLPQTMPPDEYFDE